MLRLSRALGFAGSLILLLVSLLFLFFSPFYSLPGSPRGHQVEGGNNPDFGFFLAVFFIIVSAAGIAASFIVLKRPKIAGTAIIITGALMFILMCVFLPGIEVLVLLPLLLLVAAGLLALISYKKTSVSKQPQSPGSAGS